MVKIRLKRMGMKKHPFYRLVIADERSPRDGRFVEQIGYYNPMTKPAVWRTAAACCLCTRHCSKSPPAASG